MTRYGHPTLIPEMTGEIFMAGFPRCCSGMDCGFFPVTLVTNMTEIDLVTTSTWRTLRVASV